MFAVGPFQSTLHCVLFKSYMSLEYYEKAHASLAANLDAEWQLLCLRHFVSELCAQGQTRHLLACDHGPLHQHVLGLVHARARLADLRTHDFYGLLYALRLKRGDCLEAAACMFECAARLQKEVGAIRVQ